VQGALDRFEDLVHSRLDACGDNGLNGHADGFHQPANGSCSRREQEAELWDEVQALCILARSGVETSGWWNSLQQRCEAIAGRFAKELAHVTAKA
jgi:hypothetical protein